MKFVAVASPRAEHQMRAATAVLAGARTHGIQGDLVHTHHHARDATHVAVWGWRMGKELAEAGKRVLVMERGYIGDRFRWSSLAWGGLNGRGDFGTPALDDERFDRNFASLIKPWNAAGSYQVICGQVPGDAALAGRDLTPWYRAQAARAERENGLPVFFRPHPRAVEKRVHRPIQGLPEIGGPLEEALAGAALVITWNSNAGVDATLAGKPVFAGDRGSMAWAVAQRDFSLGMGEPVGRLEWARSVALKQWSDSEIASGQGMAGLLGGFSVD